MIGFGLTNLEMQVFLVRLRHVLPDGVNRAIDIRALRSRTKDGPFAVAECSRSLLAASLSAAMVKNDDAGSFRLVKKGFNNRARDDVASALVLAAGLFERTAQPRNTWRSARE